MKPPLLPIVLAAALAGSMACDRSHSSPTPAPTPAPVVTAAVTGITIQGRTLLSAIGETSALTATASLTDGTTRDVTSSVKWSSSMPSSIGITPAGVVTAVQFGGSFVGALYSMKYAQVTVHATPPGTLVVLGRVREPGSSGIPGVQVREQTSGVSVVSDTDGQYTLGALTAARLAFAKDGFEPIVLDGNPDAYNDVALQRVIRIAAGDNVEIKLAPHDMDYAAAVDSRCYPCRMIRLTSADAGRVQLRVAWAEPHSTLNIWINGRLFEGAAHGPSETLAEVATSPGELIVYVGMRTPVEYYAPFTLTSTLVK